MSSSVHSTHSAMRGETALAADLLVDVEGAERRSAPHRHKQPHDTAAGCRALSDNDLVRAATMDTEQGRAKLEHSAATWDARSLMLARLDASHAARMRAPA